MGSAVARHLWLTVLLAAAPSAAHADWLFAPFLGSKFAGSTPLPDPEQGAGSAKLVYGGSAGYWTSGILGLEVDFAHVPGFFERDSAVSTADLDTSGLVTSSNVITFGLDVVVAAPLSITRESLRPYVIGGLGWMYASIEEQEDVVEEFLGRPKNSIGMNVGGGAVGFVTPRTGLRFEVRQFRSLERADDPFTGERQSLLSFWRATVGVVLRR